MKATPFESGQFFIGCNYWASNAGTHMWHEWDEEAIENDLRRLAEARVVNLRMFPLWSDFQPLKMHLGGGGAPREIRIREDLLPDTEAGRAGVDEVMLERFQRFCDLAHKYGLKLLVGLVTGWMSGRLFVPEMLQDRNVLTDPLALKWEIKFVRLMVRRFKDHPAIFGWDLGNECNCLAPLTNTNEAYVWASTISMAIRAEDQKLPIVSGMHGLGPEKFWRPQDQAEFLDILTTHPYPIFTPHCDTDPLNQMKSPLHATAESLMYAGIGGIPCFAEETGVLGPMVVSDENAADYIRMVMFTLMAHDCRGMMWWCANEQSALAHTPYDWDAVERELGLFRLNGEKKPVLEEMTRFSEFVEKLPFETLPQAICDAVCVLPAVEDVWAVAHGTFILAKMAGLNIRYVWSGQTIPDAKVYIVPSIEGTHALSRHTEYELIEKVKQGAKLVMTMDGPLMSPFADFSGVRVLTRAHHPRSTTTEFGGTTIPITTQFRVKVESVGAEVMARTAEGDILLARNSLGEGEVWTLLAPIEKIMSVEPGMVDSEDARPYHLFYRAMGLRCKCHVAEVDLPTVGLTEHIADENTRYLIVVNYEPFAQTAQLTLSEGWTIASCMSECDDMQPDGTSITLKPNNAVLLIITKH